ncbi:MAG: 1-acyl-sn-glycerol-3-phosphate acyltransferase [Burkholderiaceae bacterium]|nr:1-acyl-sn-glycerol-3-phosphate acyltransferase [Burkholderiaceae bacterium]
MKAPSAPRIEPQQRQAQPLPLPGTSVPRRDYGALRRLGLAWFRLSGWRIEGEIPDLDRAVVAVAPHSSNWDFVHAVAAVFSLGLRVSFIGKHTLFRGPFGRFLTWLGGIPVDRARPDGVVEALQASFGRGLPLWFGVAPEGTRREGAPFKSGFYRVARAAGVPIVPVYLDYRRRVIGILAPCAASLPVDEGVAQIRERLLAHGRRR